jgi:hypothetical protein
VFGCPGAGTSVADESMESLLRITVRAADAPDSESEEIA